jgi:hypothetical protein
MLGQAAIADWQTRAQAAVSAFDALLERAKNIGNLDARGALLEWVSSPEVPGAPAERYQVSQVASGDVVLGDLLAKNPKPTDAEIRHGLEGNLCRCTGYQNIVAAIKEAAPRMKA